VPYKEGPNFGQTLIGQLWPVCHISDDSTDTEADEVSPPNSLSTRNPGLAPGSPKSSPFQAQSAPTALEELPKPEKVQLSGRHK